MAGGRPTRRPFAVGLNLHHDTSASVITPGAVFAAEEERWSQVKHHIGPLSGFAFPANALSWCLSAAGIDPADVDEVWVPRMSSVAEGEPGALEARMVAQHLDARVHLVSHHAAHAYSSGLWQRSPSMVLCVDGGGSYRPPDFTNRERVSGFTLDEGMLEVVHEGRASAAGDGIDRGRPSANSLGHFYRNLAIRCIPPGDEPEGSMMALAAFGGPSPLVDDLRDRVRLSSAGHVEIAAQLGNSDRDGAITLGGRSWSPATAREVPLSPRADLAWAAQHVFEQMVVHVARHLRSLAAASDRLTFVGGCALNAQAAGRLATQSGFDEVFVPPAPHDGGTAIGAAVLGWHSVTEQPLPGVVDAPNWGPAPHAPGQRAPDGWPSASLDDASRARVVARLLGAGSVVALVEGAMEFGPRALGHRSILARPDSRAVSDRVNAIKRRAPYRPLAPAVVDSRWPSWFEGAPDRFMNRTTVVRTERRSRLRGVVHVDGSARAQSVTEDVGALYRVLVEFERITGLPIVLNTSLSTKGKPIVRTAEQALDVVRGIGLDAAVIEDQLFLPPDWGIRTLSLLLTDGAAGDDGGQVDRLMASWFGRTDFALSSCARSAVAIAALAAAPDWPRLRATLGAGAVLAASGLADASGIAGVLAHEIPEDLRPLGAIALDNDALAALGSAGDRRHGPGGSHDGHHQRLLASRAAVLEREMLGAEAYVEDRLPPFGVPRPRRLAEAAARLREHARGLAAAVG